jgi:hypothetical protein
MNRRIARRILLHGLAFAATGAVALNAWAQDSQKITVKKATVVYVSGNDLVVKNQDGAVKHFVVPKDFKFHVNGKDVGIDAITPGTELTQTITTTAKNSTVTDIKKVDAKVWQVNAPYLIVTLPDGKNKQVKVPDGTKFAVDGQQKSVFELRPGMQLTGTIVTKSPQTDVSTRSRVSAKLPPPPTPDIIGVLLIEEDEIIVR